jgi:DNA-binding MarR family transcriptional regulator
MMRTRSKSSEQAPFADRVVDDSNVLFELWRLARAANALLAETLTNAGVTGDEYGIYSVLATVEAMSPSSLAEWMSAPATTVSSHLKRLEGRGHVRRRPDPNDGRAQLLELTPAGRATYERATTTYLPILARVQGHLGASEPRVRRALVDLRAAVDAAVGDQRSD